MQTREDSPSSKKSSLKSDLSDWRFYGNVVIGLIALALVIYMIVLFIGTGERPRIVGSTTTTVPVSAVPFDIDPAAQFNSPWTSQATNIQPTQGVLTFRGNPTRTYYGKGPVPSNPKILWRYPSGGASPLCGKSTDRGKTATWCGTGWTGQPALIDNSIGGKWLIFGAYDHQVHFLDAETGQQRLPSFLTGDIIKTSITVDPDSYPLIYFGSRDNYLYVVAIDGAQPRNLFQYSADYENPPTRWNNDWDSSPLVIGDYLLAGSENSNFHIFKLNRSFDELGRVQINPSQPHIFQGWDDELLAALRPSFRKNPDAGEFVGNENVSIESSPVVFNNTLYFANSGGLVQGWDLTPLAQGKPPQRVFRYWAGDDIDSSLVVDVEGMLYVGVERDRLNARSTQVGQIIKLNPQADGDPLVWSVADPPSTEELQTLSSGSAGVWSTVAIHGDTVFATTQTGRLLAIHKDSGEILWEQQFNNYIWSSPVIIGDVLLVATPEATTNSSELRAYDIANLSSSTPPTLIWQISLGGTVESTPIVWKGKIYIGNRAGFMLALGN